MDGMHGDLTRVPLAYPLAPVEGPRLVLAGCEHPVRLRRSRPVAASPTPSCAHCGADLSGPVRRPLGAVLAALEATPLADRTPVLAVGSNAAAAVMRHKLGSRGVSTVVPVLTGVVRALDVSHSAHVSRGGYVPAAPVHRSAARTPVVLQLLDDDQLAAVDETEPTYERVEVSAARYPILLPGGVRPRRVHVYSSRFGVIRLPGRGPTPLLPQTEVLAALQAAGVPHTSGGPEEVSARLAGSPDVRRAVGRALRELGLVRDPGLFSRPAGELRWGDALSPPAARGSGVRGARLPARQRPRRVPRTTPPPRTPRHATGPRP